MPEFDTRAPRPLCRCANPRCSGRHDATEIKPRSLRERRFPGRPPSTADCRGATTPDDPRTGQVTDQGEPQRSQLPGEVVRA
jgi:hypothetical protein